MRDDVTVLHTALIYTDRRDRNRLIESYLARTKTRWSSLTVLSTQPHADTRYFRSFDKKLAGRRGRPSPSIIDVRNTLAGADPAQDNMSVVKGAYGGPDNRPLVLGDWLYEVYGRFEVGLAVEEAQARAKIDNLVCCYRGEGFWSLDCRHIARALELHRRVLFGSAAFEMMP